jgi:hypothetical protein
MKKIAAMSVLMASCLICFPVCAQMGHEDKPQAVKSDKGPEGHPRREPPPQAYEDCKGKKEGDKLMIHPPHGGEVPATCENSPKGLFARPEHPPKDGGPEGRPHREPPPQAYDDCKGKKQGDKLMIHPPRGGEVPATCENSPKGLFARPEHPPKDGGPQGPGAAEDGGPAD